MNNARPSPELLRQLFNLAVLLTFTAGWMLIAVAMMRSGLGDTTRNQFYVWTFLCISIWLPFYAISNVKRRWVEVGAVASVIGALLPIFGLFFGPITAYLSLGMIFVMVVHLAVNKTKIDISVFWKILVGSIPLAIVLLSLGGTGRLLLPEEISMGRAHSDAYFHIAMASMIAKFHTPSIGADGLEFTRYHFGSHSVAAGLASISEARVSEVYVYWSVVMLRVQLIWGILWCSLHLLSQRTYPSAIRGRLILLGVFVALTTQFFESESFLLACAIFLSSINLISHYLARRNKSGEDQWAQLAIIISITYICAATKVSVGYFMAALLIYASLRDLKKTKRLLVTFAGLIALAMCTAIFFYPSDVSLLNAGFGILLASYLQYATLPTLLSFLLPIFILLLQFIKIRKVSKSIHDQRSFLEVTILNKKIYSAFDFLNRLVTFKGEWQILFVSLVACVLVVVTVPIGSNAAYFSGVLLFMSFALIPEGFFRVVNALSQHRLFNAFQFTFLLMLIVQLFSFGFQYKARVKILAACEGCQTKVNSGAVGGSPIEIPLEQGVLHSLNEHRTFWTTTQAQIDKGQWSVAIRDIQKFAATKPGAVVFVPTFNEDFWTRLKPSNPYWCISAQLMIPAQIGVPMLRGISPARFENECMPTGLVWYGFGKHQAMHRSGGFDDTALCELTISKGFDRVYILNSIAHTEKNRKLFCT
jgi:hypothetical protein